MSKTAEMPLVVPSHIPYPLWKEENTADIDLRSCHGAALARLGRELFFEDCVAEAIEKLSQALLLNESARIREWRAACYIRLGDYDQALSDLDQVVDMEPDESAGYNNRGLCYWVLKRTDEALADLRQAIEVNPTNLQAYANKAYIHCAVGQYAEAQEVCSAGLRLDSTHEELLTVQDKILDERY